MAEVLEGAEDANTTASFLRRFRWQGIHQAHSTRVALLQQRAQNRMWENDAWQVAVALEIKASLLGHDPKAFSRLGDFYIDHRA